MARSHCNVRCSVRVYCWLPLCHTLQNVASSVCYYSYIELWSKPITPTIERQKNKHVNWKFEDVGLKCQFHHRLHSMLDAAPVGVLRVKSGTDANRLTDLLTFMSKQYLRAARKYLGCGNLKNSMCQGRMSEQRRWMLDTEAEAVSHWNIVGWPRSGPLAELKWSTRAAFRHVIKFLKENEDQLHFQSMLSKLRRGECNYF